MEIRRDDAAMTLYEAVGGTDFFAELVDHFYAGVAADTRLRPMYPRDLTGAKRRLQDFLVQYWGGPADYSELRGPPRLRMRHAPFEIGQVERDAWMENMMSAVDAMAPESAIAAALGDYFEMASTHMINVAAH